MVDLPFAAKFGFQRLDRHAARHGGTIAAALAYIGVDKDAFIRVYPFAALAQAAALGCAGLIIDNGRHARALAHLPLHQIQIGARVQADPLGQGFALEFFGFICDQRNGAHTFGADLVDHRQRVNLAIYGLATRHGNKAVMQQLIGDIGLGRYSRPNGHHTGMEIGAIAHIGEDMLFIGKGKLAQPRRPLAAHLGDRVGFRGVTKHRHSMATNTRQGAAAIWHMGRSAMRAARAKRRHAQRAPAQNSRASGLVGKGDCGAWVLLFHHAAQNARNHIRVDLADIGKGQFAAIGRIDMPIKGFAHNARRISTAVKMRANLVFQQRALFLDHNDRIKALGKLFHNGIVQRPDNAHFQQAHRFAAQGFAVKPHAAQRLVQILPRLTGRHHADAGLFGARQAVHVIGANIF